MYIPEHFREDQPERLSSLIKDYPFGMLVTAEGGLPMVSHLPFLFEPGPGRGKLLSYASCELKGRLAHTARSPARKRAASAT